MRLAWKKILLIIGFIALVVIIGYLLYFLFLKPTIPSVTPQTNVNGPLGVLPPAGVNVNIPTITNANGALPTGANANVNLGPPPALLPGTIIPSAKATGGLTEITPLTTTKVLKAHLASDGNNIVYYDKDSGLFYKITPDGRSTPLSDQIFYEVSNITWSSNSQKAVLEYPDESNIVYDFSTKQQVTLPQHWKNFSFSPNNGQLVFKSMGLDSENRFLAIANADGSKAKKIELLGDKDATVHPNWSPNDQIIAMYREDNDFDRQSLYFVGQNDENFKSTVIEGRGFEGQWSTKGDRLLYSVYSSQSGYKPTLWIVEAQGDNIGQNRINLNLETWSNKCSFGDNDTVYCAVPKELQEGAGIFSRELDNSPSEIYKIDLRNGFKSKIAIPTGNHNIENVVVNENGDYLYFTSKTDGRLYKINLK